jgi:hypothetical protein
MSGPGAIMSVATAIMSGPDAIMSVATAIMSGPDAIMSVATAIMSGPDAIMSGPTAIMSVATAIMSAPATIMSVATAIMSGPATIMSGPDTIVSVKTAIARGQAASTSLQTATRSARSRGRGSSTRSTWGSVSFFRALVRIRRPPGSISSPPARNRHPSRECPYEGPAVPVFRQGKVHRETEDRSQGGQEMHAGHTQATPSASAGTR